MKAEVTAAQEAVKVATKVLDDLTEEESTLQMKMGEVQAVYEVSKRELDELEERMSHCSAEIVGLKNERTKLVKQSDKTKLESKKLSVTISKIKKERANNEKAVSNLVKKYPWIDSEKSAFGVRGGDYDFEANNPKEASKQLKELKAEQESLVSMGSGLAPGLGEGQGF